jgi:hypothetical protein
VEEKETAKPKAAKNEKKPKRRKNDFHEIYFEAAEIFCFIYSVSVDEVSSVFGCAPSVEVIKRKEKKMIVTDTK